MNLFYRLDKMKVLSCSFKHKMISEKHLELHISHHKSSKSQYILANNLPNTIRTIVILKFKTIRCLSKPLFKTHFSSPFPSFKLDSVSLLLIAREPKCFNYRDL